ncbi:MAG: adenosylmethionine--8-amino-7-oxononanoate transaminase [Burkholderiaceae bacterium]
MNLNVAPNNWISRTLNAVWHPCTQMKQHELFPPVCITRGQGPWLYSDQDQAYMDCISSWWTNLFGHANARINQAIVDQLNKIEHVMLAGLTHPNVVELSEELSLLTQGHLGHAFYASDGASAVEIALKMSHHFWRIQGRSEKNEFICLANGYHGETLGALSVTDVPLFKQAYAPLIQGVHVAHTPDFRKAPEGIGAQKWAHMASQNLESLLEQNHSKVAAVILEPLVQCAGQMGMYDPIYLRLVRKLCDRFEVHLICDEIAVGCGRTGTFFASEAAGIWPDFLTLSKGISAGYLPLSLSMTTEKIYQAFYADSMVEGFLHSHSYTGNPLACAAALASLRIFKDDDVLKKNKQASINLKAAFSWVENDERLIHFRQQGMILAFDLSASTFASNPQFASQLFKQGLKHQLLLRPIGQTVYVMPPYILDTDQIHWMGARIKSALYATLDENLPV